MKRISILFFIALIFSLPASAERPDTSPFRPGFESGNELFRHCNSNNGGDMGICIGYIQGVVDELESINAMGKHPHCTPLGAEASQARDIAVNYLSDHPEMRDLSASALVTTAIMQAWKCK
jgi:hypothetical protein